MLRGNSEKDSEITKASVPDLRSCKEDDIGSQRVYKKSSANSVLTLYLGTRDVICRQGVVEPLKGIIYIDPKYVSNNKVYGQLTLTFRYGREDEEVMGLKFCNEAIMSLKQIWPVTDEKEELTCLQRTLMDKLGKTAHPFSLDVGCLAPPSVQLIPAKRYNGAPIGTSYDIRVHMADPIEERIQRRSMIRLGVRVLHKISPEARITQPPVISHPTTLPKTLRLRLSPKALKLSHRFSSDTANEQRTAVNVTNTTSGVDNSNVNSNDNNANNYTDVSSTGINGSCTRTSSGKVKKIETSNISQPIKGPEGSVDKPFLWTEGRVSLKASLNKSAYRHGEHISVTIDIRNDSKKSIRKIRIFAVQHVDVVMFSNGKFKNVVADIHENDEIKSNEIHRKVYSLLPIRGPTKNWIAVEGNPSQTGYETDITDFNYKIASSAPKGVQTIEERNVFAIYVSYYIKVKLQLSGMGGEVSLKLPFILGHLDDEDMRDYDADIDRLFNDGDDNADDANMKDIGETKEKTSVETGCSRRNISGSSKQKIRCRNSSNSSEQKVIEEESGQHDEICPAAVLCEKCSSSNVNSIKKSSLTKFKNENLITELKQHLNFTSLTSTDDGDDIIVDNNTDDNNINSVSNVDVKNISDQNITITTVQIHHQEHNPKQTDC